MESVATAIKLVYSISPSRGRRAETRDRETLVAKQPTVLGAGEILDLNIIKTGHPSIGFFRPIGSDKRTELEQPIVFTKIFK